VRLDALVQLILAASIVLNVFGLGLEAAVADLAFVVRRPALLVRSLLAMNVLMPLLAALLAAGFGLRPPVKIALLALAVSPVPPLLPRRTTRAGGEPSYALGLLIVAALVAIVYVPFAIECIGQAFRVPLHGPVATIAKIVALTIVAPLGAGILARSLAPRLAERAARAVITSGLVLLAAGLLPVLFRAGTAMASLVGNGTLAALACFTLTGLIAGHVMGGPSPRHRVVLAIATAFRHPGIAVAIAEANFPDEKLVPAVVLLYLLVATALSVPYVAFLGRGSR
jgi:BASS family bile acid:Na+ symporter